MRYRTLTKNKEFSRIYARGKSYVHPNLVLYVAKNRLGYTRIGLTATKKVGHAVQRNRARRIMRAALSEHLSQNIGGYDNLSSACPHALPEKHPTEQNTGGPDAQSRPAG